MRNPALIQAAILATVAGAAITALAAAPVRAEEGMWTLDNFPIARANQLLGTNIDQAFLDRVQLSAAKYGGCSAGFVSGEGLLMTNNHCVRSCVADLSTTATNYTETGFAPRSREEELKCPGGTVDVLTDIGDVTERMHKAGEGLSGLAFTQARDAEAGRIEREACGDDRDRRCQVVSLYRGGQFKLYTYKRYSDVRLAFAPEAAAADFGGDPYNFSFPRYSIDAAFIRVYEDGRPAATPNHFKWTSDRPVERTPVFVVGTPGATQRLLTQDQVATVRDVYLPLDQIISSELRGRLIRFSEESAENEFMAFGALSGVENTFKRGMGRMKALVDAGFIAQREQAEADFRARVAADPAIAAEAGDPWGALSAVQDDYRDLFPAYHMLESRAGGGSALFSWARTLVRAAQERAKPSEQRLPEYADSRLRGVESGLMAERPSYPTLNQLQMEWWLSKTREVLTADDPRVEALLGAESPEALSARLVEGTRLADPAVRRALWDGGLAAIEASDDPMIRFALAIQAPTRAIRAEWEDRVDGPTDRASEALAAARFAAYGDSVYPDATGTLRVSFGLIEGSDVPGQKFGPFTTFGQLWNRATGAVPFQAAPRLLAARDRIDPDTVLNMAVSSDTIGGSSGSPVITERMEILGANFDSTVMSQRNAYGYDRNVNRSVIVTTAAVAAALRDVYGMGRLLEELEAE
ncbi:MAG: S46 family peptidase [Brevundimonas sp.]|uniref:S46 family peptidase n=1 Tax=Brevundimonas sp. TaxID=1871086 RepID=UPI0025BBB23D|nr:S46 family peptidase [Brevundimonas sp.]MBX3477051.1 S46 family peptidase [Brevundimonas sp.]